MTCFLCGEDNKYIPILSDTSVLYKFIFFFYFSCYFIKQYVNFTSEDFIAGFSACFYVRIFLFRHYIFPRYRACVCIYIYMGNHEGMSSKYLSLSLKTLRILIAFQGISLSSLQEASYSRMIDSVTMCFYLVQGTSVTSNGEVS